MVDKLRELSKQEKCSLHIVPIDEMATYSIKGEERKRYGKGRAKGERKKNKGEK